jgi:manganese peroxidase
MGDAGLSPQDTVNLLASHSVARSDTLIPNHDAVPFDSTPFTFDTQVYLEVLLKGTGKPFNESSSPPGAEVNSGIPEEGEMRLQSDFAISRDQRTACFWQEMVDNQQHMVDSFKSVGLIFCHSLYLVNISHYNFEVHVQNGNHWAQPQRPH